VPRFDLADFLAKTGLNLRKLATYLQVAPAYLEAALAGEARLTARDQAACRLLWRRVFQGKQLQLPFAEPPKTFTRDHTRAMARARAMQGAAPSKPRRASRKHGSPQRPAAKKLRPLSG
jgi:hypothetical protein